MPRHLFSGIFQCSCGGMITVRSSVRDRPDLTRLACAWHRRRGPDVCENDLVIRQDVIADAVLPFIQDHLLQPEAIEYALGRINQRIDEENRRRDPNRRRREVEQRLAELDAEIARLLTVLSKVGDLEEFSTELQRHKVDREDLRAELKRLSAATKPKWLTKWTREAVIKRVDCLWQDLQGTDIARARLILRKLLGPAGVEIAEEGKAWKLTFEANPLVLFIGDRAESFHGSGGGIQRIGDNRGHCSIVR